MYVIGDKIPKSVSVADIRQYILLGISQRNRMGKSNPYEKCKTKQELDAAIQKDAEFISESYKKKSKEVSLDKLREFYKEIVHIQFGLDPVPRVGDFYEGHTVTDVISTDRRIELYGVLGKLRKAERDRIIEDSKKLDCLRDKMKRRGYRFAVLEVV
jgi:hypothetical protein